jgi:hypothetical protein
MFKKGHKGNKKGKKVENDEDDDDVKSSKKGKKKKGKKKKFMYPTPKDFKPFFVHLFVRTGKDGLIQSVEVIRFKGKPSNPKVKSVKLSETDPEVLVAVAARLAGPTYKPNPDKRLPPKMGFRILARVGQSDGNLRFGVKEIIAKRDDGAKKKLSKKDPRWRMLRKCSSTMPSAFMRIGVFPKIQKEKKKGKEKDE